MQNKLTYKLFENKQAGILSFNHPFAFPKKENDASLQDGPTLENNSPAGFQLQLHQNFFRVIYF